MVVRDSDGGIISRFPLPGSGDFQIEYIHSYYNAPTTEHFTAGEDGDFELVGVSSPSEAVLDYYVLEGRKEIEGDRLHLVLDEPQEFEALPLIGTQRGRRTLVVSGERYPLYGEGGARHIVLKVEKGVRGAGREAHVARQGEVQAGADGDIVHRGDHGLLSRSSRA